MSVSDVAYFETHFLPKKYFEKHYITNLNLIKPELRWYWINNYLVSNTNLSYKAKKRVNESLCP